MELDSIQDKIQLMMCLVSWKITCRYYVAAAEILITNNRGFDLKSKYLKKD